MNIDNKITSEIFDHESFSERLLGNQTLIVKVLKRFIVDSYEQIQNLRKALVDNDANQIKMLSHKLKGSASTVSCIYLSEIASQIESHAKCSKLACIHEKMPKLEKVHCDTIAVIKASLLDKYT